MSDYAVNDFAAIADNVRDNADEPFKVYLTSATLKDAVEYTAIAALSLMDSDGKRVGHALDRPEHHTEWPNHNIGFDALINTLRQSVFDAVTKVILTHTASGQPVQLCMPTQQTDEAFDRSRMPRTNPQNA